MVAASFLVKDLLSGPAHRRTVVPPACSSMRTSWKTQATGQWVAGTGPDAAPYFRVFNPVRQSKKFDPDGEYIRAFVPELAGVPTRRIHSPWTAPSSELAACGVTLGSSYPHRIIDHDFARGRSLNAFAAATKGNEVTQ